MLFHLNIHFGFSILTLPTYLFLFLRYYHGQNGIGNYINEVKAGIGFLGILHEYVSIRI